MRPVSGPSETDFYSKCSINPGILRVYDVNCVESYWTKNAFTRKARCTAKTTFIGELLRDYDFKSPANVYLDNFIRNFNGFDGQ